MLDCKKRVREIGGKYGSLTGIKYGNKKITHFESSLERDYIYLLEFDPKVNSYQEQPLRVHFKDRNQTKRIYTPDFLVESRNSTLLVEIKYQAYLDKHKDLLEDKFNAAHEFCSKHGIQFKVITENEIRGNKVYLDNLKFLSNYSMDVNNFDYIFGRDLSLKKMRKVLNLITTKEKSSVQSILNEISSEFSVQAEHLYWIWCLLSQGWIKSDLNIKLTTKSVLWIH